MRRFLHALTWRAQDYAFAGYWQVRGLFGRKRASEYVSGSGRPILIIPGIWEAWTFMMPLINALHAAGHPVHVLTALHRNGRPVVDTAQAVAAYILEHDLRHVVIVAHSKGGLIGKYAMAMLDESQRIDSMVAVCTPFSGSRYASYLLLPSLRAFSPRDATTVLLGESSLVNHRIVSIFPAFDPHIPEGSALKGARNIQLELAGHFRVLGQPETIDVVLEAAAASG